MEAVRPMAMNRFFGWTVVLGLLAPGAASAGDYRAEVFVPGHGFHAIHGITFDSEGGLYVGSVVGQSIYRVDAETGAHSVHVGPPNGMADDLEFGPDGTLTWTSFSLGKIHARKGDGPIRELASGLPGINSLAFKEDGRLFATQVFLGDALYEIDRKGEKPARMIMEGMGGLNGFDFGPDGYLYGPLWFKGQVVRVDVDTAELTVVAEGFDVPAAANFDSKGNLWVLDTGRGHVVRVDVASGEKTVVSQFKTAMDNLAFDSRDRLFVTVMAENAVYEIDTATGAPRTVKESVLALPADLALFREDGEDFLYIADTFAARAIKVSDRSVRDLARIGGSELEYPGGIDVTEKHVHLTSWFGGAVQTMDRKSGEFLATYHDFQVPMDVLELDDGSLLVAQLSGQLVRVWGEAEEDREVVARDLAGPVSLARAGEGKVYVSLHGAGEIVRLDVATGATEVVAKGLSAPEGLAVGSDGRIVVAEVGTKSLVAVDPSSGAKEVLVEGLPVGLELAPGQPPVGILTGVAVSGSGAIFVASDLEDALYKVTRE